MSSEHVKYDAYWLACRTRYSNTWLNLHGCVETDFTDCPFPDVLKQVLDTSAIIARIKSSRDTLGLNDLVRNFLDDALTNYEDPEDPPQTLILDESITVISASGMRIHRRAVGEIDEEEDLSRMMCCFVVVVSDANEVEEEWHMPNVQRRMTMSEAGSMYVAGATNVRSCKPMAAIYANLSDDAEDALVPLLHEYIPGGIRDSAVSEVLSLSSTAEEHEFCSTVFTDWPLDVEGDEGPMSLNPAYRYSRFATTAMLRQLNAIGVDLPVFGVFFMGTCAYAHMDWVSEEDEYMHTDSALIMENEEIKEWDMRSAKDALEFAIFLENLRQYTIERFTPGVNEALQTLKDRIDECRLFSWKWNGRVPLVGGTSDARQAVREMMLRRRGRKEKAKEKKSKHKNKKRKIRDVA